jgi:hypothetical protein
MGPIRNVGLEDRLGDLARRRGALGFAFGDLIAVAAEHRATPSQVMHWLAAGHASGALEDLGFQRHAGGSELGPRRFRARRPD